jgi:membrane protease YdiL (CAAX protease family)
LGLGAVALLCAGAVFAGAAHLEAATSSAGAGVAVLLLAGAAGEELLFRGYAFQAVPRSARPGRRWASARCLGWPMWR